MATRAHGIGWGLAAAGLAAGLALAGVGPSYRYGEVWWLEYASDSRTALLLHMGRPAVSAGQALAKEVETKNKEADLLDAALTGGDAGASRNPAGMPSITPDDLKKPPVDDRTVPPGTLLDYSDSRQKLSLPAGMSVIPDGRFGDGLRCTGGAGLKAGVKSPQVGECQFRVAAYPDKAACLMSFDNDEAQLLLRPDGRLELKLRQPHGIPDDKKYTPETLKTFMERDAAIVSPDPVPLNAWTHVAIWNKPHPAPGNTSPFDARLTVNGDDVAFYMSEGGNRYQEFLGRQAVRLVIGNSADGKSGFSGDLDEVRVSSVTREFIARPPMPWRDAAAARPLQFGKPWFRGDDPAFHVSFEKGPAYDRGEGQVAIDLKGKPAAGLEVEGVRGKGWLIDPLIGFPSFATPGLTTAAGTLEFWLRPVNWDDITGYWHHSPPANLNLSVCRVYAKNPREGKAALFFDLTLPRAFNNERSRIPLDPGHWTHVAAVWSTNREKGSVFINGKYQSSFALNRGTEPAVVVRADAGITTEAYGSDTRAPRIELDEVVGYNRALAGDEVEQALARWKGPLEPIRQWDDTVSLKYSLMKLEFSLKPLLPAGIEPAACTVSLCDTAGKPVRGPFEMALDQGRFKVVMNEKTPLAYGPYEVRFQVKDGAGKVVIDGKRAWEFKEEPWRTSRAGILDKTPAPWTPIVVEGREIRTAMTTYTLGGDGLPAGIRAAGEELLAAPFRIEEAGQPLAGTIGKAGPSRDVETEWMATFQGKSVTVAMACRAEYDGMVRYELTLTPRGGPVQPVRFVMPVRAERATRYLFYPMGARGVSTGSVGPADGKLLESRVAEYGPRVWPEYRKAREKNPSLKWETWFQPRKDAYRGYGFFGHVDVNDRNRGLFWFCDNAAGWSQSTNVSAVELERKGDAVTLALNLVAEAGEYAPGAPIVFGILPHPARPLPAKHRLFERASPALDPKAGDVFDAFYPWPMDPREQSMKMYPAPDPKKPEAGPSWDYAERCIPSMKAIKTRGLRAFYLSRLWFGCRAGAYDNWEWRSGEMQGAAMTPSFVSYLCAEMDEWIRRDIWDAIYLDECYETPVFNLEAGLSVRLPDGTEQPGVCTFGFRELMKRWRNIFTAHGREPVIMAHHTLSWQYPGLVFCDMTLDGENHPIVSLNSRDWIDSTSKERFEAMQNARLWGVSTFYMPFIAEGGFDNKEMSQHPRWQWRMARQAQSEFAHYETATVYEGQGSQVYKGYWKDLLGWGAGPLSTTFHPYWDNAALVKAEGQGSNTLVSIYRQPGKVLLIASNRQPTNRTIRVELDLAALGLRAKPEARALDSTFEPPAGDDFAGTAAAEKEAKALLESAGVSERLGMADARSGSDLLNELGETDEEHQRQWTPVLEGRTLILPVRGKDYRVVTLE